MSKTIIIADSTQINTFLQCPEMWNLGHRQRLIPSNVPDTSEAAQMGQYGHFLLENFYKLQIDKTRDMALKEAFETPMVLATLDPVLQAKVRDRVRLYTMTHTLGNDFVVNIPEQVEVGFSCLLYEDEECQYVLEGRIDLFNVRLSGLPCVADHKFQLRRHDLYKKSIQFRNYAMVTESKMLIINYIRLSNTIDKDTFKRDVCLFTQEEHRWWRKELIHIFDSMRTMIEANWYQQRWSSCSGLYGNPCDFTRICEEPNKETKELLKQQLYRIKPEWKPW
jgi:hypothetical protein